MSAANDRNQPLRVSILDRLIDEEPHKQSEVPKSPSVLRRELSETVRRDLENLLNTRWRCATGNQDFEHMPESDPLKSSLVNYGIPDFCGGNLGPEPARKLVVMIEDAIRRWEPRLRDVRVRLLDKPDAQPVDRTLRMRIDAVLCVEPIEDHVSFDSRVKFNAGDLQVRVDGSGA